MTYLYDNTIFNIFNKCFSTATINRMLLCLRNFTSCILEKIISMLGNLHTKLSSKNPYRISKDIDTSSLSRENEDVDALSIELRNSNVSSEEICIYLQKRAILSKEFKKQQDVLTSLLEEREREAADISTDEFEKNLPLLLIKKDEEINEKSATCKMLYQNLNMYVLYSKDALTSLSDENADKNFIESLNLSTLQEDFITTLKDYIKIDMKICEISHEILQLKLDTKTLYNRFRIASRSILINTKDKENCMKELNQMSPSMVQLINKLDKELPANFLYSIISYLEKVKPFLEEPGGQPRTPSSLEIFKILLQSRHLDISFKNLYDIVKTCNTNNCNDEIIQEFVVNLKSAQCSIDLNTKNKENIKKEIDQLKNKIQEQESILQKYTEERDVVLQILNRQNINVDDCNSVLLY